LVDLGAEDRTILRWILRKSVGRLCSRLVWQRMGGGGWGEFCERGDEPSDSIHCRKFIVYVRNC
jgi:hypothetical protein